MKRLDSLCLGFDLVRKRDHPYRRDRSFIFCYETPLGYFPSEYNLRVYADLFKPGVDL